MRYHIITKTLAILLCAAMLLGVVGGAAGVIVLSELNLYKQTTEEVYTQRINQRGTEFATELAARSAGTLLGNCSIELQNERYGDPYLGEKYQFHDGLYSYTVADETGSIVLEVGTANAGDSVYTIPVTGKYMYLVSLQSESEKAAETAPTEQTLPETVPTTVPETVPETVPTTVATVPETLPPETYVEEEYQEEYEEEYVEEEYQEEYSEEGTEEAYQEETMAETLPPETVPPTTVPETIPETIPETVPGPTIDPTPIEKPILINGVPITEYEVYRVEYFNPELQETMYARYVLLDMPGAYTVTLRLQPGAVEEDSYFPMLALLRSYRTALLVMLFACLLVGGLLYVFLCCVAARSSKTGVVRAGGLNRLPIELYALGAFGGGGFLFYLACVYADHLGFQSLLVSGVILGGAGYISCLAIVGFFFAIAAQCKTPDYFLLKNSLCGLCLRLLLWLWHQFTALLVRTFPAIRGLIVRMLKRLKSIGSNITEQMDRFFTLLPLTWQWLLAGFAMVFALVLALLLRSVFLFILVVCGELALVLWNTHIFGVLLDATKRMGQGNLNEKIDTSHMTGAYRTIAENLNNLADVTSVAVSKQLKSERMKTELITNVSHDIKTPLTSIVSYVDLLQKNPTPEEQAQYLEVLARQSQQLKKLIEDLIEMSRASTGNMTVELGVVDAVESVNQALGEFSDKLETALITPVFRHEASSAAMMADGKLVWRVLHNLLSNAVKYALPGTRLYIDLLQTQDQVLLSLKNVSREELNIGTDELMERFVRGDSSRNTEGSGLGLNIAKSMMELQHGQLQILIDGDLFKVTLIFPAAPIEQ